MSRARSDGVELEYETTGDPADPLIVLIRGLGSQLIAWDERFWHALAARGFEVVRFDNRDIGRSSRVEGAPRPDIPAALRGDFSTLAYGLEDMAGDVVAVVDAIGRRSAHLVGISMGGMIAQLAAIRFPDRVASLCSMMSTTGARGVGKPNAEGRRVLMRARPRSLEDAVAAGVDTGRAIGSPAYPPDDAELAALAEASWRRSPDTRGLARQLLAVLAATDRTDALGAVDVPTLVVHGDADPLVGVDGGVATATAIPGAKLLVVPGMGHDLPPAVWPLVIDAIVENASRALS